jgi:hypothetical protein
VKEHPTHCEDRRVSDLPSVHGLSTITCPPRGLSMLIPEQAKVDQHA